MCNAVDTMAQHDREQTTVYSLVATTLEQVFAPRDESRVAIILTGDASITVFYSWGDLGMPGTQITIPQNGAPLVLSLPLHGDMVRGPWRVRVSAGSQTVKCVSSSLIQSLMDRRKA